MKFLLQILLLFITWFTNLNATPIFAKVALPNYELTFSKTENVKEESIIKIGVQHFAKSNIEGDKFNGQFSILSETVTFLSFEIKSQNSHALIFKKQCKSDQIANAKINFEKCIFEENRVREVEAARLNGAGNVFTHVPTSGALITNNAKQGTFLIGSYPTDLQQILGELNYPKIQNVDFAFPVPSGQKFNLLNISDAQYNYWAANGGFFTKVNGPWIDAAVLQNADVVVVSNFNQLYNSPGVLSGFGKEIHRLEWKHGYRFDPTTKMMVPPSNAAGLPAKTLQSEYTH
jgi:hypothetical protein